MEESLIALKPENMSFEEAASFPLALQTAKVCVVQLAKYVYGASKIATTTSTGNVDFFRQLGFSELHVSLNFFSGSARL